MSAALPAALQRCCWRRAESVSCSASSGNVHLLLSAIKFLVCRCANQCSGEDTKALKKTEKQKSMRAREKNEKKWIKGQASRCGIKKMCSNRGHACVAGGAVAMAPTGGS